MDKYVSTVAQEFADHQLYWNLKKIARACDLRLKKISDDEYVLFRMGETENDPIATFYELEGVVFGLANHIRHKATADVNRGIILHKEKGIEKYR